MQPKNVMLLGFVNKAVEYLDQNMEDPSNTKLASLKHIDLVKLKKELSDNLDASLGIMQSTMTSLLTAGSDAFNEFLTSDDDHETLVQQMAREFDFNFDEENDDKKDLNELLSFYNLDKKFDEVDVPQVEEAVLSNTKNMKEPVQQNVAKAYEDSDETKAADLDDESLELMRLIQNNVNKVNNGSYTNYDQHKEDDEINEIFSEIELNDAVDSDFEDLLNNIDEEAEDDAVIQHVEETANNLENENKLNTVFNTFVNQLTENYNRSLETKEKELPTLNLRNYVEENNLQNNVIYSIINAQIPETVEVPMIEAIPVETLVENVEKVSAADTSSFSQDLIDELRQQMIKEDTEKALKKERDLEDSIIDSVLNASYNFEENKLENKIIDSVLENEEVQKRSAAEKAKEDIFGNLKKSYPILSDDFIASVYALKQEIADAYNDIDEVVVLHRVHFNSVDDLRQFAEIVLSHNYQVNVDEKKLIVDVFKEFKNVDGKILSNIFEIANQGAMLYGTYEGYRVITN